MRIAICLVFMAFLCFNATAKEHIIERGETLESVALMYNVTTEEIIIANPALKDMFFAGMVIEIPDLPDGALKKEEPVTTVNSVPADTHILTSDNTHLNSAHEPEKESPDSSRTNPIVVSTNSNSPSSGNSSDERSYSNMYLLYFASLKAFEHGWYGIGFDSIHLSGWGFRITTRFNWGTGDGNFMFTLGPSYSYAINDIVTISAPLQGFINTYDKVTLKSDFSTKKSIEISGGIFLTPMVTLRFGKLYLGLGYDLGWQYKYNGLLHGLEIYAGINI